MNRRAFLLASVSALAASKAYARMSMHNMSGMGEMMSAPAAKAITLPEGAPLRMPVKLANTATQAGRFTASLTAAPAKARLAHGVETPILAYNGQSPGPLIEVTEGDRFEVAFANRIPDQDSTVHWHGLSVPADQDGGPMEPVASGADRIYAFDIPAGSAGSYWYHPHPHHTSAEQVYRGLAGALIVKPKIDPVPAAYGDTVLFLTDLRLAPDGTLPASRMSDMMNGRVGDHVLVNGQKNPTLAVPAGAHRRFRLYNATNARYLKLSFGKLPITIIGTDGGLLEAPVQGVRDVLLAPAERLEIVVAFTSPGTAKLTTLGYDRGWMGPGQPKDAGITLLTVKVASGKAETAPPLPAKLRAIAAPGAPALTRRFVLGETMGMGNKTGVGNKTGMGNGMAMNPSMNMDAKGMNMGFVINGASFDMKRVDEVSKVGQTELWEISNPTDMDHPFHIHGTQFQVVETELNGVTSKPPFRALKDTVNVARGETVRLLTRQDFAGFRMYHCHILEHEDLGMMGLLDVKA